MAILKNLIVNGVTKLLSDVYLSVVKSGTWNGSTIGVAYGGTGVTSGVGNTNTPVYLDSTGGITACGHSLSDVYSSATSSLTLSSSTKLSPSGWTTAFSISGLDTGTYAIQILYNNSLFSGVFSVVKSVNNSPEEIPLHCSAAASSVRLYAAINGTNMQLSSTSELSSGTVTIKYKRII